MGRQTAGAGHESPVAFDAPPKTDAGKREVSVPPHVMPILEAHMKEWQGLTVYSSVRTISLCVVM